jgi:hypothetical protein
VPEPWSEATDSYEKFRAVFIKGYFVLLHTNGRHRASKTEEIICNPRFLKNTRKINNAFESLSLLNEKCNNWPVTRCENANGKIDNPKENSLSLIIMNVKMCNLTLQRGGI